MPRGGGGGRPGRKDYALLRDGATLDADADVEDNAGRKQGATVLRLLGLAKEEWLVLSLATVMLFIGSLSTVAVPKLAGQLVDICIQVTREGGLTPAAAKPRLNRMLEEILAILAIGGVASGLRGWLFNSAAERVMNRLRVRLFSHLAMQEIGFFDRVRTGELMNRLSEDTRLMNASASVVAEETFGSIRTVRSFAKEPAAVDRYAQAQGCVLMWGIKSARLSGGFFGLSGFLASASITSVLWFGARLVVDNRMSAGDLSSFVIYALFVGGNVASIAGVVSQLIQATGASKRVFELMDRVTKQPPAGIMKPSGNPQGGEVELRDVWFAYPSRPDIQVLKGLSLHVRPGLKVALVGPSGQGKSTIVNLIQRFYDPQQGAVLLDGVTLPALDHAWLHRQVAIVSQEPVLFAESLFYNIAFGAERGEAGVSLAQVEEAAKLANAHDFISSFPQGYRTQVGERGVRLSGGQKQRVAIARAILLRPRVLLLDEATSALDAESEALVQEALDRVAKNRTVLVIAHRLSTVQSAAEVAVVSDGNISERGTHTELLARGGRYATLVARQMVGAGTSSPEADATKGKGMSRDPSSKSLATIAQERGLHLGPNMTRQDTSDIVDAVLNEIASQV
ncbi:hypothetical protein WJX73_010304 [Symbiochloris irregularis]|uniref:Uncharacterized protein n=1 Tax=Symbiochloris irregularis TaxID=706552 RepID=A0AAW1PH79_9CHLO